MRYIHPTKIVRQPVEDLCCFAARDENGGGREKTSRKRLKHLRIETKQAVI
jgi:hypothetical protein